MTTKSWVQISWGKGRMGKGIGWEMDKKGTKGDWGVKGGMRKEEK